MKKLNLNITLKEPVKDDNQKELKGCDVAIRWIGIMVERALNLPDIKTMRPTVSVGMQVQRKFYKVMDVLESHKDGIVEMEDDLFDFMSRKFAQAEIPIQRDITEILIKIDDVINKAKADENRG